MDLAGNIGITKAKIYIIIIPTPKVGRLLLNMETKTFALSMVLPYLSARYGPKYSPKKRVITVALVNSRRVRGTLSAIMSLTSGEPSSFVIK
jgi:hypothetical protein